MLHHETLQVYGSRGHRLVKVWNSVIIGFSIMHVPSGACACSVHLCPFKCNVGDS